MGDENKVNDPRDYTDKAKEVTKYSDRKYRCKRCLYEGLWIWIKNRLYCPGCGIVMTEMTGKIIKIEENINLEWQENAELIQEAK